MYMDRGGAQTCCDPKASSVSHQNTFALNSSTRRGPSAAARDFCLERSRPYYTPMELSSRPSLAEIHGDSPYAQLAQELWLKAPTQRVNQEKLKNEIWDPLEKESFAPSSLLLLENLQIVEKYLWPGYKEDSSNFHVMLIAIISNIKQREGLPTWSLFADRPTDFSSLFRRILSLLLDVSLESKIRTHLLVTIIGAFQSLDSGLLRKECAPLVSIAVWNNLASEKKREALLQKHGQFKKAWRASTKRLDSADDAGKVRLRYERSWLYTLLLDFLDLLYNASRHSVENTTYCERFMEFLADLQSQFPTRRYVNTLLQDMNILVAVKLSPLYQDEDNGLMRDLFALLRHYTCFPIDDHTGLQRSPHEVTEAHSDQIAQLQRIALRYFKSQLMLLVLSNQGSLEQREELRTHLDALTDSELDELAGLLGFRIDYPASIAMKKTRLFVLEIILFAHTRRPTLQDSIKQMALLPTEAILYEPSFLRNDTYNGSRPLAIPKLNLQYLTIADFLWRSFILSRCEAFYEIRKSLEDTVKRAQPKIDQSTGQMRLGGSSRMALKISKPAIIEVVAAKVGEQVPSQVRAEITLDVSRLNDAVRREWETLRPDDVVFLLAVKPSNNTRASTNGSKSEVATEEAPYQMLRAAEILQVLDDNGRPLRFQNDQANGHHSRSRQRRLLVKLDAGAYQKDLESVKDQSSLYEDINLIIRRRSRENNFKPILESIQRLVLSDVPLPSWLQDVFLGLGDPAGASYKNMQNKLESLDFRDTFMNWQHLVKSFPGKHVEASEGLDKVLEPPFVLRSVVESGTVQEESLSKRRKGGDATPTNQAQAKPQPVQPTANPSKKRRRGEVEETSMIEVVKASTYKPLNTGPYPTDAPKTNTIPFTPSQVEAITAGTQPGLTVIVGPPGTGKTDVATQVISNIYHNFPEERTLLIAHSNQALNQLFQKIVALDIDERHLLRLGHGEGELHLENEVSFSKHGRVESFLENGARFLSEVNRLAASLGAPGAHGNSCETADYFNSVYVKPVWTAYADLLGNTDTTVEDVISHFPFHNYFANAPQPLFPSTASKEDLIEIAEGCHRHIVKIFSELEDLRPFETLRHSRDKTNYLLTKEAKIIAMTSTHAAIRRQEIAKLGFRYENVVMEEAAQITEIENFIPLALQKPDEKGRLPLKRVILCGDHLQNSPIVQNLAFRQYANLEQSLFLRLVRLGVPAIMLDKQGRARSSLAELYKWRYTNLGDLPIVSTSAEYTRANAGFRYDYQFINVPDYKGRGEVEPTPHFIQNLGEAEYAVAIFMYMRLLGYPASKISILTTYAGQRALIKDVLGHRCAKNRLFGLPRIVTTVDKYQGEQNDCT